MIDNTKDQFIVSVDTTKAETHVYSFDTRVEAEEFLATAQASSDTESVACKRLGINTRPTREEKYAQSLLDAAKQS